VPRTRTRTRKDGTPVLLDEPEIEGRDPELGDLTVAFTGVVEVSPTEPLRPVMAVLAQNMAAVR
jgi:hypothetical protein